MPDGPVARKRFLSTVLMTDIVSSTEHAAELGDSGWRDLVQMHHALVRAALKRHNGREVDTAGDGFFAVFDAPAAAVDCALDVANGVRKLGIEIRAGVHVGEVEEIAGKVGGISVPIAARIMSAAGAGEVLVSATVRELAAGAGLIFHDRGVRELKGVPGEWHVFAVGLAEPNPAELVGFPTPQERRASAVRWSEARPFWQRHPRLSAGIAGTVAVVLVTSGLLVWRPWQPPALASLAENSVGIIDPDRNELTGEIPVGIQPGGIAISEGYAWVTNTGAGTVSQIDLTKHAVMNRIKVGRAPTGIAVSAGSVWVTNSGERSASRISIATGDVVDTIDVGNGPTAIVASGDGLWVVNTTDSTVIRLDAESGARGAPIGVVATPVAVAADTDELWVASEVVSTVSQLDPDTGETIESIQVPGRPSAIALDAESLWVAAADGTVIRIDRETHRVTRTIDVGGHLNSIAVTADSVWVGDRDGYVHRLTRADSSSEPVRTTTVSSVAALAVVKDDIWAAAQSSVSSHRGGTLRILLKSPNVTDPLGDSESNTATLVGDGLVGFRRVGGVAGATLLPDLAMAVPLPTPDGLTYTFQLRPNLVYSNAEPVRPADFRRAIERGFQMDTPFVGISGVLFFSSIVGAEACLPRDGQLVERFDLSEGIVADEAKNSVTFHLTEPDPDFLFKLATRYAYPVREGTLMHGVANGTSDGAFLGTGPYVVVAESDAEVRLVRNPHFKVWDPAVRPDGFPDEIVYRFVEDNAERLAMVEHEEADYMHVGRPKPGLFQGSQAQYGGQWHIGSVGTIAVWLNTGIPPFDDVRVRQALNLAIDRDHMAGVYGGPPLVAITCQVISPGFPGYRPYCPYTRDADSAGGQWRGSDLAEALRLVEESGTKGDEVLVGPSLGSYAEERDYIGSVLDDLGYHVIVDKDSSGDHIGEAGNAGSIAVWPVGWGPDYLAPSIFFSNFTCKAAEDPYDLSNFCNHAFDGAYDRALQLQATNNPAAAWQAWAEVDEMAVDLALWAPLYNPGGDFVSARVGNYQFSPSGWALFDQMWVKTTPSGSQASPSPAESAATPAPTAGPPSPLEGTWATGETTCAQQNAAVESADFTDEQIAFADWRTTACADEPPFGSRFSLVFEAGRLLQYSDGYLGWLADYRIVDENTFQAGDSENGYYVTFDYAIDGDKLTIDMTQDTCPPCGSDADLAGEQIVLTVIFETSPFSRQP